MAMQSAPERVLVESRKAQLKVLAINSLFPNQAQPYWGIFNACALKYLSFHAQVRVISPVKWFPGLSLAFARERQLARIPRRAEYHGMPVTYPRVFRTPGFGRALHGWFYNLSIREHVRRVAREYRPDLILASWTYPDGFAVQQIGEELGIPVVIKCLGSDIHQLLHEPRRGPRVLRALKRCTRIVTVSEHLRQMIVESGIPASKIDRVYNGVDSNVFFPQPRSEARRKLGLQQHGKLLLCIANLLPIKRHSHLLQAFKLLRHGHQIDARLVLLGEGPLRKRLMREARALHIASDVYFAGSCKHDQVPLWINAADLVCLASQNEGLPNALVESLACGRPVVATSVGGIPELIGSSDYGELVGSGDVPALSQALRDVLIKYWDPYALSACPKVISWKESTALLLKSLQACV